MAGTEDRNRASMALDQMSCEEIVCLMNRDDQQMVKAVEAVLPKVAVVAQRAEEALKSGGRLIYVGAGTSGRLGVLDASECPPTFGVSPDVIVGVIAGGDAALRNAVEGAEDDAAQGAEDMKRIHLTPRDMVFGIAASGRTPYVIGALRYAGRIGCATAALVNNAGSAMAETADLVIDPDTGAEVLTGSTRLKAGSSQKLILNMISTSVMVRLGKVYENLMVDVQPTNEKLRARAERIVLQATGANPDDATKALREAGGNPKLAITMLLLGANRDQAEAALLRSEGHIRQAVSGRNTDEK